MSSDYLTLSEIIEELRALTSANETGTFFVVSEEQHSAMFGFKNGRLVALQCRLRFGEKAIPLIANIKRGKCRFDDSMNFARRIEVSDNEEIFQAILSTHPKIETKHSVLPPAAAKPAPTPSSGQQRISLSAEQRKAIGYILSEELGPMANVVMSNIDDCTNFDEVFAIVKDSADGLGIEDLLVSKISAIIKP
jgi:hypothetical protein